MEPVRVLLQRSSASLTSGATLRAVEEAREALVLARGDGDLEASSLDALGAALWARGDLHTAAVTLGAADRLRQGTDQPLPVTALLELAQGSPGWQEGLRLSPDEVVALLTPRGRPRAGWNSLTPAERSVVELAVEGLSNPRIAQKLFLSTNTVKTHLQRAYRKLGITSRGELSQVRR
ncbi:MAG: putative transcriptional regulatory protein (LuxR-family) [Frankiales bacterium]|nr:putative transcriptional regulatory protein (LuxR-family) [Frankiales bacterium]